MKGINVLSHSQLQKKTKQSTYHIWYEKIWVPMTQNSTSGFLSRDTYIKKIKTSKNIGILPSKLKLKNLYFTLLPSKQITRQLIKESILVSLKRID